MRGKSGHGVSSVKTHLFFSNVNFTIKKTYTKFKGTIKKLVASTLKLYFQKKTVKLFFTSHMSHWSWTKKWKFLIFLGLKTCAITQKLWVQSSNVKSSKVNFSYLAFTCKRNFHFIPKNLVCRPMLKNWGKSGQLAPHSNFCKFYCHCNFTLKKNRILVPILKREFGEEKIVRYSFFWFHSTDKCLKFLIKIKNLTSYFLMV